MNILTETHDDKTVLTVKEERVDAHNAAELKDRILKALEQGSHALVIDLRQVQFIDSSGLGALLSGFKNANLRATSFALAGGWAHSLRVSIHDGYTCLAANIAG